jgi:hypothetical protein
LSSADTSTSQTERLERRLQRERRARLDAEAIAEAGMRQLFIKKKELELLRAIATAANEARSLEEAVQHAIDRSACSLASARDRGCHSGVGSSPLEEGER